MRLNSGRHVLIRIIYIADYKIFQTERLSHFVKSANFCGLIDTFFNQSLMTAGKNRRLPLIYDHPFLCSFGGCNYNNFQNHMFYSPVGEKNYI